MSVERKKCPQCNKSTILQPFPPFREHQPCILLITSLDFGASELFLHRPWKRRPQKTCAYTSLQSYCGALPISLVEKVYCYRPESSKVCVGVGPHPAFFIFHNPHKNAHSKHQPVSNVFCFCVLIAAKLLFENPAPSHSRI